MYTDWHDIKTITGVCEKNLNALLSGEDDKKSKDSKDKKDCVTDYIMNRLFKSMMNHDFLMKNMFFRSLFLFSSHISIL